MKNLGNLLERAKLYMLNRLSQNGSRWPLPETFNGPSSIQYVIIVVMRIYAAAYVTLFPQFYSPSKSLTSSFNLVNRPHQEPTPQIRYQAVNYKRAWSVQLCFFFSSHDYRSNGNCNCLLLGIGYCQFVAIPSMILSY